MRRFFILLFTEVMLSASMLPFLCTYVSDFEDVEHSDGSNYYGNDYAREDDDENDKGNYLCQECCAMRSLVVLTGSGLCP